MRVLVVGWGIAMVLVALLACGGSQTTEAPVTAADEQPSAEADPGEGAVSEGAQLVADRCTTCHDLGPIEDISHSSEEWLAVVNDMIARGAILSESERDLVVGYLAGR